MSQTFIYIWTISHYGYLRKKLRKGLDSPCFRFGPDRWYIRLYPKGISKEFNDRIGLFVHRMSKVGMKRILCGRVKFAILDRDDNALVEKSMLCEFTPDNTACGFSDFTKRVARNDKRVLTNDALTVRCELTIDVSTKYKKCRHRTDDKIIRYGRTKLSDHLQAHFKRSVPSRPADIVMAVKRDGPVIMAHKVILAARSSLFENFITNFKDKHKIILMREVENYEMLQKLVTYMYTGLIGNIQKLQMAKRMIRLANSYKIYGLKDLCGEILGDTLNLKNVSKRIALADKYKMPRLMSKAWKYAMDHLEELRHKRSFRRNVPPHMLFDIFENVFEINV